MFRNNLSRSHWLSKFLSNCSKLPSPGQFESNNTFTLCSSIFYDLDVRESSSSLSLSLLLFLLLFFYSYCEVHVLSLHCIHLMTRFTSGEVHFAWKQCLKTTDSFVTLITLFRLQRGKTFIRTRNASFVFETLNIKTEKGLAKKKKKKNKVNELKK